MHQSWPLGVDGKGPGLGQVQADRLETQRLIHSLVLQDLLGIPVREHLLAVDRAFQRLVDRGCHYLRDL